MKFFPILFVLWFFVNSLNAQIIYSNDSSEYVEFNNNSSNNGDINNNRLNENNRPLKSNKSKISYNVNIGSSISAGDYGSSMNLYTAPKINYNFTPKLSISAGVIFVNSTFNSLADEKRTNTSQAYLTNSINYQASERLKISGEILYGLNSSPYEVSGQSRNQNYYVRFNAEYKISKNLTLGIQLSRSNGMYYPHFGGPGYNPFYNDPFSSSFIPFSGI